MADEMRRVLITGSRNFKDRPLMTEVLDRQLTVHEEITILEGGAQGADRLARDWARGNRVPYLTFEADWDQYGPAAGPRRNSDMVASGADICLAFPLPGSKGTYDCMRKAEAAGIRVVVCTWKEVGGITQ